uniref:Uncharacterized protein n=1 Tax=Glossina palpalis gambiensis TaxID=67801 RepID=A0A1B0C4Y5_9MUSC
MAYNGTQEQKWLGVPIRELCVLHGVSVAALVFSKLYSIELKVIWMTSSGLDHRQLMALFMLISIQYFIIYGRLCNFFIVHRFEALSIP